MKMNPVDLEVALKVIAIQVPDQDQVLGLIPTVVQVVVVVIVIQTKVPGLNQRKKIKNYLEKYWTIP